MMQMSATKPSDEIAYNGSMKILVIEDDREAADYLQKAFAEAGHTAHVAGDGETGFALADAGDYDVMVIDRMMPRRDGLSVIAGLRSRGKIEKGFDKPILHTIRGAGYMLKSG